jgi:hypothetical protein
MSSVYRDPAAPRLPPRATLEGPDEVAVGAGWFALLAVAPLGAFPWLGWSVLGLLCVSIPLLVALRRADRRTRRFALRIEGDDIVVESRVLGWFRLSRCVFSLEDEVSWSNAGDDWEPVGLSFVAPPWRILTSPAWEFGPVTDAAEGTRLCAVIREVVQEARRARSAGDADRERDPACGDLHALWFAVDLASVERNEWGRVRSLRLATVIAFRGFARVPAGTELRFGDAERWLARATPDRVTSMVLSEALDDLYARCMLDGPSRPSLPGATVTFDREGRVAMVNDAFDAASLGGRALVGRAVIGIHQGVVMRCTLAESLELPGHTFGRGCEVSHTVGSELTVCSPEPVTVDGKTIAAPLHYHCSCTEAGRGLTLAEVLRDPARYTTPRGSFHSVAGSARVFTDTEKDPPR